MLTRASESIVFGLKSTKKSTKVVKKRWRICSGTGDRGFESRRFDQRIRLSLKGSLIFNFRDSNLKVLRRLANIVVVCRSSLPSSTPCFLRALHEKQLSTVFPSFTRRFDQKDRFDGLFLFCRSRRGREHTSRIFTMLALGSLLIFVRILPARELGSHSPRRARSEAAREH